MLCNNPLVSYALDASAIPNVVSRAVTFENPNGLKGAGGTTMGGRKGSAFRMVEPGERVTIVELDGPGCVNHLWLTFSSADPVTMRSWQIEGFYDGADQPSISAPCLDFFGLAHGRPTHYVSLLTTAQEGRGFNSYMPVPFRRHLRLEVTNNSDRRGPLYFQADVTLGPAARNARSGLLHVTFRRENPTILTRDFLIEGGLAGPGRFVGCAVGVRVLDPGCWYGEGEVKIYLDGDTDLPTICGTGMEDYACSAWLLGPHFGLYAGAPLIIGRPDREMPDFVSFYRWHLADPIVFESDIRVTLQQLGVAVFLEGQEALLEAFKQAHVPAGAGWQSDLDRGVIGQAVMERQDDLCATAFTYCVEAQAVPRVAVADAIADLATLEGESPLPERLVVPAELQ
jgi:hypothetical protein